MSLAEVCALATRLQTQVRHTEALNAKLTHEMAVLKRLKFAATSKCFSAEQKSLLEEAIDEDLEALAREVENLQTTAKKPVDKHITQRQPLPSDLPRRDVHHELEHTTCRTPGCGCQLKRIGEDISEKLDYLPGSFAVERHVRGKWACAKCQTLIQAPVPAAVIDKGLLSNFHLFDEVVALGPGTTPLDSTARSHLERLGLGHKVSVQNGRLSTTDLSTGQRKRLALLHAYLERRPVIVLDEWAADQDPEFREMFYTELLPELESVGICWW